MTIELNKPFMSIESLQMECDLPDFAVLMGRNGVGKTQLLDALVEGTASIKGIPRAAVEKYDMNTFAPQRMGGASWGSSRFAASTATTYLENPGTGPSPVQRAAEIYQAATEAIRRDEGEDSLRNFESRVLRWIERNRDFTALRGVRSTHLPARYTQQIAEEIIDPLSSDVDKSRQRKPGFHNNGGALVSLAMKLARKLPHDLTREDILRAWHYEGDILDGKLSQIFVAHLVDQFLWAHRRIESSPEGTAYDRLMSEYEAQNPPPWDVLRKAFDQIREDAGNDGLFDFDFSDPGGTRLNMANYQQYSFQTEMTNRQTGDSYGVNTLSSGEQVLMSLCLMSFNERLGRRRPKLLLLDELDAVLHPSMIRALCTVLKRLYVGRGTKVMMTTHSPVTVTVLDEGETFRMTRQGRNVRIAPTTKSQAVHELSEGICTVDVGLRIAAFDGAKITILSEGLNALHLKRWAKLHFGEEVRVIDALLDSSNDSQLYTYAKLLAKMVTNTKFVVVWDCDAKKFYTKLLAELNGTEPVVPHLLERRENRIAPEGIENKYDEELLEPFANTTTAPDGEVISRNLGRIQKTRFADYIYRQGTMEDFRHFSDLREIVNAALSRQASTATAYRSSTPPATPPR